MSPAGDPFLLDKGQLRRSFNRAARNYDASAVLQREVCARMLERLPLLKISPRRILDAGSGTGHAARALRRHYPGAQVIELDLAWSMLQASRAEQRWWRGLTRGHGLQVCADIERMPLRSATVELLWSNLALQWSTDLSRWLSECLRVLAPEGLFLFSSFGPDTLRELRAAFAGIDGHVHVNRFVDMHDLGDLLVSCGFAEPVLDMERFTLTYAQLRRLMLDLKALGAHNVNAGRPRGLGGRKWLSRVAAAYESVRTAGGELPATFEVVYGLAWKPRPRTGPSGHPVIDIKARVND
jgi:malonyl-CoA O-methyltransferase